MTRVLLSSEMSRIEKLAYEQGAQEEEFMKRAGSGVAGLVQRCLARDHLKPNIALLCGRGNNAGDAYVAGSILQKGGFQTHAFALAPAKESSKLCQLQAERYLRDGGKITYVTESKEIELGDAALIIDGILGTGFHGKVEGLFAAAIEIANGSNLPIVAIDIPSGIDGNTGEIGGVAIHATDTLFLGLPKTGCFLGEAWNYVGKVHIFDFGLEKTLITDARADFELIDEEQISRTLPCIQRVRHKYQAGYVVGLGGSPGMPGAAILSSYAALRSGAGIVRLLHPEGMEGEFSGAPHEIIREGYRPEQSESILKAFERASSLFIGPGIGTSPKTQALLEMILPKIDKPCVIDAEALSLLAKKSISLPKEVIMTPQHAEMKRLLGITEELQPRAFLKLCQEFAEKKKVTLIVKGAPTFIMHPGREPLVCARGDPGMATAGSGDVLTGIVAAFLAQKKSTLDAALLGVYLHSVAGECAAKKTTSYCMVASDITAALPEVFSMYQSTKRASPSLREVVGV